MRTICLIAAAFFLLGGAATAKPPPLPDHPVTGKPVQPTWPYWIETESRNGLWKLWCLTLPNNTTDRYDLCFVIGYTHAGAYAIVKGWYVLTKVPIGG